MSKDYRVTPKNKKWIVQKIVGRSTVKIPGSPFIKKSDAEAAMFKLIQTFQDKNNPGITFVDAFKKFADMKLDLKNDRNRVTLTSLKRYKMTYDLRIKKYMDHPVTFAKLTTPTLLSNFKLDQMEAFLKAAFDDGVPFKTLRNTVKDIKHFLKQANLRGWNSCRDMETFKIYDYAYVFPKDDSLITKKATNVLDEATCFDLILSAYKTMKNNKHDRDSAMRFAIFSLMFMFGLRASELLGLKKSSIDLQNGFLNASIYTNQQQEYNINISVEYAESEMKYIHQGAEHTIPQGSHSEGEIDASLFFNISKLIYNVSDNYSGCIQVQQLFNFYYTEETTGITYIRFRINITHESGTRQILFIQSAEPEDAMPLIGDVNNDLILNIQDIVIVIEMALNGEYNDLADLNGDGEVNILDVVNLIQMILS